MRVRNTGRQDGRWALRTAGAGLLLGLAASFGFGQTAGDNVNMVSGTQWPGGDPFLQRDNEPSMAASSLNLNRLLAGANTYRTVDLPFPTGGDTETGDAWLGIWKSFDAGRTWQTYLLPGYPQDTSAAGAASPLKARGLRAGADATVRAGTNGFFAMSGIAFNRQTDDGVVFVARFIDLDIKENGNAVTGRDTMPYVDTVLVDTGTSGQFLDKPWIAVDIPRPFAQGTCTITAKVKTTQGDAAVTRSFPTGPMYMAWSRFTGNLDPNLGNNRSTKLVLSRSLDCGKTWSNPTKISEGSSVNQGATIGIDPLTGAVYVAWRRFGTSSQTDAILVARSTDGQTFPTSQTREIASFLPFDQGTSGYSFRTNALPSIALSVGGGLSRAHVAWSQRSTVGGDARIVVATSSDGSSWSAPAPVDSLPAVDERGVPYVTNDGQNLVRGHQVMPQMTFAGGKLMVLYYDLRLDHTSGVFVPKDPFEPDATGAFYDETREKRGELAQPGAQPEAVYKPYITDAPPTSTEPGLTIRRHTIDVRVAQADPGPTLAWRSAPVSRYRFGTRGDETGEITALPQLQVNPPNLPLFQQGTAPFIGDYIDIIGQMFLPPTSPNGPWRYNLGGNPREAAPVFYATWTSNQDVRPPADGDWTHYTPVGGGGQSVFDPSQTTDTCAPGQEGMRNQNIYMSRITQGLSVSSPQSSKPLSPTLERAFVVLVDNATSFERIYRLSIAGQPPGGRASFLASTSTDDGTQCFASIPVQGSTSCTALDVTIPPRSSVARSVFVKSTDAAARLTVNVDAIAGLGGAVDPGGLSGYVLLNATPVTALADPDGGSNIAGGEVYDPSISFINVSNPNVSNVNVSNPNVSNVNVSNINVSNPNVSNINVSNPDIADINVSNINVSNPNVSNINVSNPNVSNINVSNEPVTDASYTVTNTGNTTHSYHVQLVGEETAGTPLQLILTKPYVTPTALNCVLGVASQDATLASIASPQVVPPAQLGNPAIPDSGTGNATLALAPGETAIVTIRGGTSVAGLRGVLSKLAPAIVAHGHNGALHPFAAILLVTSSTEALPAATVGVFYTVTVTSAGGTKPIAWSFTGQLPPGLNLNPATGTISGTPSGAGSFLGQILATDSAQPQQTAGRPFSLTVNARTTSATFVLSPGTVAAGQPSVATLSVTDTEANGMKSSPSGAVTVGGTGLTGGTCTLASTGPTTSSCSVNVSAAGPGAYAVQASFAGSAVHAPVTSMASLTVTLRATATGIVLVPATVVVAQPSQATITVSDTSLGSASSPAGSVTLSGLPGVTGCTLSASGTAASSCQVTVTASAVGNFPLTALYTGDPTHGPSTGSASLGVSKGNTTTTITSDAPDPSTAGKPVVVSVTVAASTPATGTPSGTVSVSGGGGNCTITLASGSGSCSLTPTTLGSNQTWTASYTGDGAFGPSSGTATHTVNPAYTFTGFLNPLTTATVYPVANLSGSWTFSRVLPIKWQIKNASGTAVTSASAVSAILALYSGATCATGPAPALPPKPYTQGVNVAVLYTPTSGAAGGSDFRPGTTYNFNWDATKNARVGCWSLVLQLDDGSSWATKVLLQ